MLGWGRWGVSRYIRVANADYHPFIDHVEVAKTKIDARAAKNALGVPCGVKERPCGPFFDQKLFPDSQCRCKTLLIKYNQSAMLCYYIPPKTQGEFIFSAIVHTTLCRWCLSPTWKKTVTPWANLLSEGAILF